LDKKGLKYHGAHTMNISLKESKVLKMLSDSVSERAIFKIFPEGGGISPDTPRLACFAC